VSKKNGGLLVTLLSIALCLYTLVEVNYPRLQGPSQLALFVMFGLVLCFLTTPAFHTSEDSRTLRKGMTAIDYGLIVATIICCGYVVLQTERTLQLPWFNNSLNGFSLDLQQYWADGLSLGNRAGVETNTDFVIGMIGLVLVLEGTRRSIGWIVPALALVFVAHSYYCYGAIHYGWPEVPDSLLPHSGQDWQGIASTTFLQSQGVFGQAADVMFRYVFLFVVFGAFLEMSGATQFIIDFAQAVFGRSRGGPAMVSVLGSGLMGSLSGSAVANAVTTGSFTIPMMRSAGFKPHVAGGITAAAAAGGALVPPVMGAGAYMMLELIEPQVTFLEVAKAALIPALLYYLSVLLIVYFYSHRIGVAGDDTKAPQRSLWQFEAIVFFGALAALVGMLLLSFSPFKAVTGSLTVILVLSALRPALDMNLMGRIFGLSVFAGATLGHHFFVAAPPTMPTLRLAAESWIDSAFVGMYGLLVFGLLHSSWRTEIVKAFMKSAKNGVALVAASACVGVIIGIVQQTGIANDFSAVIKSVVESNLLIALIGIMICSLILGMGVPSVVCYLLMATLMGSLLGELGVAPLAAHLFIFYFGMMSMVTPPVALAAYASASIAEAKIMPTALSAFSFSLVGFTLPFMFVYRPELLLMAPEGETLSWLKVAIAVLAAVVGIIALAAGITGFLVRRAAMLERMLLFAAAASLLIPIIELSDGRDIGVYVNLAGGGVFLLVAGWNWKFGATTTPALADA